MVKNQFRVLFGGPCLAALQLEQRDEQAVSTVLMSDLPVQSEGTGVIPTSVKVLQQLYT